MRFHQGRFKPKNIKKYKGDYKNIIYRSSWECKVMIFLDSNKNVLQWSSEEIVIPYYSSSEKKNRRYFTDFWVKLKLKNGNVQEEIWEVKPFKETLPPKKQGKKKDKYLQECITYCINQDKWEAARKFCRKKNMIFRIITEKEIN